MPINAFQFFKLLDDYLMVDLKVMVCDIPPKRTGGLGYPSMQTILSGMELLGRVLSGNKRNRPAFYYFWDNFFIKDNPKYDNPKLKKIFRNSIRNGVAHYFLTKFGIQLSKSGECNLTRTSKNDLNIDIITFYEDFKKTYLRIRGDLLAERPDKSLINNFELGYKNLIFDLKKGKIDLDDYIKSIPECPRKKILGGLGLEKTAGVSGTVLPPQQVTTLPPDMLDNMPENNE